MKKQQKATAPVGAADMGVSFINIDADNKNIFAIISEYNQKILSIFLRRGKAG
jgi:hypothetical protein